MELYYKQNLSPLRNVVKRPRPPGGQDGQGYRLGLWPLPVLAACVSRHLDGQEARLGLFARESTAAILEMVPAEVLESLLLALVQLGVSTLIFALLLVQHVLGTGLTHVELSHSVG